MSALSQHVDARLHIEEQGRRVQDVVCKEYGISRLQMIGHGRNPLVVEARRVAIWLLMQDLELTSVAVGQLMFRDHSTVLYHANWMHTHPTADELSMVRRCRAVLWPTVRPMPVRTTLVRRMA